jgi:phosphate transport system ATP-binding protein
MLLDEPCSALDPVSTTRIEELLLTLRDRMTIVIVTHNLRQARRIGDHCALFWTLDGTGYVLEARKATELFCSPNHEITKAYIQGALS